MIDDRIKVTYSGTVTVTLDGDEVTLHPDARVVVHEDGSLSIFRMVDGTDREIWVPAKNQDFIKAVLAAAPEPPLYRLMDIEWRSDGTAWDHVANAPYEPEEDE